MSENTNQELDKIKEQMAMLSQTDRIGRLVDIMAALSDGLELTNDATVEKMLVSISNIFTAGFVTENAVRYAKKQSDKNEVPSMLGLLKMMKDEDTRKGLAFMLNLTKAIGKQV